MIITQIPKDISIAETTTQDQNFKTSTSKMFSKGYARIMLVKFEVRN